VGETRTGLIAGWNVTAIAGMDTRQQFRLSPNSNGIVQADLAGLANVTRAVLRLEVTAQAYAPTVLVYEADPPRIQIGGTVELGIAAQYPGDRGLSEHPDVLRAGDFSDPAKLFDVAKYSDVNPHEFVTDPDGSIAFRGSFLACPVAPGHPLYTLYTSSSVFDINLLRAVTSDPRKPIDTTYRWGDEMYARMEFELERDWTSVRDGNKMALGWDLRGGYWINGRWQHVSGNGGDRGDGKRHTNGEPVRAPGQCVYEGHAIRMEAGKGAGDGNPYDHLRPVQWYVYHNDQAEAYGDMTRVGTAVIVRGRRHTIETRIKLNSIVGPFDSDGNGVAVHDGELTTWLDGVLVANQTGFAWRCHPEMGVMGPFIEWLYGGKHPSEVTMHYKMNHFALATRYIGPRVG
jgi:hypothetical protein